MARHFIFVRREKTINQRSFNQKEMKDQTYMFITFVERINHANWARHQSKNGN
jgi:hypothetical protein